MGENSDSKQLPASRFQIHSRTDVGKRRKRNEDSLGVIARHGLFVVADGMGGVDGGDFCSRLVIEYLTTTFQDLKPEELSYRETLDLAEKTIVEANDEIKQEAGRRGICGMGTTVVAICYNLDSMREACVLHVGDSRAYRYRNRSLVPLTVDHSLAAESGIGDGDMVPMFMAGVITRAVGVKTGVDVERTPVDVQKGDTFLLCSDGLYNMVPEDHMSLLLSRQSQDPAADMVTAANEAGGFDNITVVMTEILVGEEHDAGNLDETVV